MERKQKATLSYLQNGSIELPKDDFFHYNASTDACNFGAVICLEGCISISWRSGRGYSRTDEESNYRMTASSTVVIELNSIKDKLGLFCK